MPGWAYAAPTVDRFAFSRSEGCNDIVTNNNNLPFASKPPQTEPILDAGV
jgi:hypothetical protein